jgi:hypothetical protein
MRSGAVSKKRAKELPHQQSCGRHADLDRPGSTWTSSTSRRDGPYRALAATMDPLARRVDRDAPEGSEEEHALGQIE